MDLGLGRPAELEVNSPVKRWLSPWVLPLVLLGCVLLITRPIAGAIWIVTSVLLVRLLNGRFELPPEDEPLRSPVAGGSIPPSA